MSLNLLAIGAIGFWVAAVSSALGQSKGKFDALNLPATNFALPGVSDAKVTFTAQYELQNGSKLGRLTITAQVAAGWHVFLNNPAAGRTQVQQNRR